MSFSEKLTITFTGKLNAIINYNPNIKLLHLKFDI